MKNIVVILTVACLLFASASLEAQEKKKSKFMEGLSKVVDALDAIAADDKASSSSGTNEDSSSSKENTDSKESTGKQEESDPVRISSVHSDISVEYISCKEVAGSVQVNFKITNKGIDNRFRIYSCTAYDDEGNEYTNAHVKLGSVEGTYILNTLPKGVPLKMDVLVANVEKTASKLVRITFKVAGLDYDLINGSLVIENIPISR